MTFSFETETRPRRLKVCSRRAETRPSQIFPRPRRDRDRYLSRHRQRRFSRCRKRYSLL